MVIWCIEFSRVIVTDFKNFSNYIYIKKSLCNLNEPWEKGSKGASWVHPIPNPRLVCLISLCSSVWSLTNWKALLESWSSWKLVREWPSRSHHLSLSRSLSLSLTYFVHWESSEFRITTWPFPSLPQLSRIVSLSLPILFLGVFSCYKGYPFVGYPLFFATDLSGILWPNHPSKPLSLLSIFYCGSLIFFVVFIRDSS